MRADAIGSEGAERIDRFGAVASSLCAVHCAICALLPAAFGALGLGLLLSHEAEWVFTLIAIGFAAGALILGWRRHRSVLVAGLLALGIAGLLTSRVLEMGEAHHDEHHGPSPHTSMAHAPTPDDHAAVPPADRASPGHHEDATHLAGTAVGVLAGVLLFFGHVFNIRTTRECQRECCN